MNDVDRAERSQAWKAFLIPASLFVACLFNAAGIYIMYSGSSVGVFFLGFGLMVIVVGMFLFITFHNQQRASGRWQQVDDAVEEEQPQPEEDEPAATHDFSVDAVVAPPVTESAPRA